MVILFIVVLVLLLPVATMVIDMAIINKLHPENRFRKWWRKYLIADLDE